MSSKTNTNNGLTINTRMVKVGAYQLYLEQIKGISDSFRANAKNLSYIPPQFGGLKGQLIALSDQPVLRMVDFTNPN